VRRVLFTPAWLGRHLALVCCLITFSILGRWQWDVSRSPTGTLQNTLYAFQWWSFGLVFIYGWWWMIRHELREQRAPAAQAPIGSPPEEPMAEEEDWMAAVRKRHGILTPPPDATPQQLEEHRAWLAQLRQRDQDRRRSAPAAS
jgi:DNA-binding transcriptional regulator of glucitol operon